MKNELVEKTGGYAPTTHPFWMGVISLLVSLYGLFFLGWNLGSVIWMLWFEVIFAVGSALIRAFFALQGQSFFSNLLFRIFITGAGAALGIAFIMLAVTFTINGIDTKGDAHVGTAGVYPQMVILFMNYLAVLVLNFFANGSYKTASPIGELMSTFVYLLILLVLIMPLTMHLFPRYPQLQAAKWVGFTVLAIKFVVDSGYSRVSKSVVQLSNTE